MQFLYADGTDAHFMDTRVLRADRSPERPVAERAALDQPSTEVDVLFIDDEPADIQLPSAVELEVTETDPGLRGDTVSGGGTKPAELETGAVDPGAAVRRAGERIRVDTRSGEYVSRAPRMRRSDQRRAAVMALYQHDLTGRPLVETLGPNASIFSRALAHAAADRARGARRDDRPPRPRLVGASGSSRWSAASCASP